MVFLQEWPKHINALERKKIYEIGASEQQEKREDETYERMASQKNRDT